jgi:membrane protease YdiL (CAAX protease family)
MTGSRKTNLVIALICTAIVFATAVTTNNSGLYLLTALCAGAVVALWQRRHDP